MKWFSKDRIYFLIPFLFFSIWLVSCAKRGNLQGGPKDKTPPQLVVDKSTPNLLTNFDLGEIVLVFDEFVELKGL